MNTVTVGLVGSGFAANLHMEAYQKLYGVEARVTAVASSSGQAAEFAQRWKIPRIYKTMEEMIAGEKPEVVDLCTPPDSHVELVRRAMEAGCDVICEKPLTGWFEEKNSPDMIDGVLRQMEKVREVIKRTGRKFFYAENFVYAPAVQKSASLLRATKDRVLFMRGEESHSGSHAAHAAHWSRNGGGSLIRQGCHPLSALLYLKKIADGEAAARIKEVVADMGYIVPFLSDRERRNIQAAPVDVEDLANVILTFADGTKAVVTAGDMILGGVRNEVQVYTTGGVHQCRIAPNDRMQVYHIEDDKLKDEYFTEKLETKTGWQSIFLNEETERGYVEELRDFLRCRAGEKPEPEAGFELAYETVRAIYAAYQSAMEERKVRLD